MARMKILTMTTMLGAALTIWGCGAGPHANPIPPQEQIDGDSGDAPLDDSPIAELEAIDESLINRDPGQGEEAFVSQDASADMRADDEFDIQVAAFAVPAAVPLQVGDTTISADSIITRGGSVTSYEWGSVAGNPKVANLIAYAQGKFGAHLTPDVAHGFTTSLTVRYTRSNITSPLGARLTVIPLIGTPTKGNRGASAALLIGKYTDTPALVVPRLLIRFNPSDWNVTEYSFRKDGRTTEMAAVHGDCLVRSGLKILEQRNAPAHRALRAALTATALPGQHVANGLRRIYDVSQAPVGQPELILASAVLTSSNVEEEYAEGYISGTLDQSFKPARRDPWYVVEAKKLAKDVFKDLLKKLGARLWDIIRGMFGF